MRPSWPLDVGAPDFDFRPRNGSWTTPWQRRYRSSARTAESWSVPRFIPNRHQSCPKRGFRQNPSRLGIITFNKRNSIYISM